VKPTLPFDPFAMAKSAGDYALSLAMRPQDLMQVQMEAAKEWGDFWIAALSGKAGEPPRDRRFMAADVHTQPSFRRGRVRALFDSHLEDLWQDTRNHYDVTPKGGIDSFRKIVAGKQLWNYDNLEPTEKKLVL